jgi:hypothetical protein
MKLAAFFLFAFCLVSKSPFVHLGFVDPVSFFQKPASISKFEKVTEMTGEHDH